MNVCTIEEGGSEHGRNHFGHTHTDAESILSFIAKEDISLATIVPNNGELSFFILAQCLVCVCMYVGWGVGRGQEECFLLDLLL